jgi:hypothetical protein
VGGQTTLASRVYSLKAFSALQLLLARRIVIQSLFQNGE